MSLKQTTQQTEYEKRDENFSGAYVIFCRNCGPIAAIKGSNNIPYEVACPRCGVHARTAWRCRRRKMKAAGKNLRQFEVVHRKSVLFVRLTVFFRQKQEVRE